MFLKKKLVAPVPKPIECVTFYPQSLEVTVTYEISGLVLMEKSPCQDCRLIIGMQWYDNVGTCHNYLTLNRNSSRINKLMRNVTWKVNTLLKTYVSHETLFPGYARFSGPHQVILRPTLVEICSWWSKQISCFGSWSMSQKCRTLGISIMSVIHTSYPEKTNVFPLGIILGSTLHFQWPKHTGLQQLPGYQACPHSKRSSDWWVAECVRETPPQSHKGTGKWLMRFGVPSLPFVHIRRPTLTGSRPAASFHYHHISIEIGNDLLNPTALPPRYQFASNSVEKGAHIEVMSLTPKALNSFLPWAKTA